MLRKTLLIALSAFGLALGACGDDTAGGTDTGLDAIFPDIVGGDGVNPPSDTTNPQAVLRLEFEQAFGDDQLPCRNTERCTISLSFNERRTLQVLYTEDGMPTAGRVVKYAIELDEDNVGAVNTLSSVTGEDGIADVEARNQGGRVGQYVLKASIDDSSVPPLYFDIVVTPKGQVPLTVGASYAGTRPVSNFAVNLYRKNAAGAPNCDDLGALLRDGTASQASPVISLAQTFKFTTFDNLEEDGTQSYTILVTSKNQANAIQAWGCDDENGVVKWVEPTTVVVPMTDRPPVYGGDYDITSRFDFISAIPEPYRTWVNYVVGFFQDPVGTVVVLACDLFNGLESFCDLATGAAGAFITDLLNDIIMGLAQGSVFGDIFQVGGDVADLLKAFDISATLSFNAEPNEVGEWEAGDTHEVWREVKVKWSLGANCDPVTEENCGLRTFGLTELGGGAVEGSFPASVANDFDLTIGMHSLNLRYGALINYFMEGVLIPLLVGEPSVASYDDLLGYLVGGGATCLEPGQPKSCCGEFADSVASSGSATANVVETACTTLSNSLPGFLRNTIEGLVLGTNDSFRIGTQSSCRMVDFNNDLCVDGIGAAANPCVWDVQLNFGGGSSTTIDAVFWGARSSSCPQ